MVIIVQSYIIVNFGYKIVSYKISIIFLDIIFFLLYYSCPPMPFHSNPIVCPNILKKISTHSHTKLMLEERKQRGKDEEKALCYAALVNSNSLIITSCAESFIT